MDLDLPASTTAHGPETLADQELQSALEALHLREKEVDKLRTQLKELLHINHQWDIEYRELQSKFDRFKEDAEQAKNDESQVTEGVHALRLSEGSLFTETEELAKELQKVRDELLLVKEGKKDLEKKLNDTRVKYEIMKRRCEEATQLKSTLAEQLHQLKKSSSTAEESSRLAIMRDEVAFLRQQLKAYQEDFEAERRDKQRVARQRESDKVHYEAEITSLKLQLDRCRGELNRYQLEANRLAQQMRLRRQAEQEQYRKHLENKGYAARHPNQALPPLDPFVENDVRSNFDPIIMSSSPQYERCGFSHSSSNGPQTQRMGGILLMSRDTPDQVSRENPQPILPHDRSELRMNTPLREQMQSSHSTSAVPSSPYKYSCPHCRQRNTSSHAPCVQCDNH